MRTFSDSLGMDFRHSIMLQSTCVVMPRCAHRLRAKRNVAM